jgi:thiol-disulfide isomerase/thioredoxin
VSSTERPAQSSPLPADEPSTTPRCNRRRVIALAVGVVVALALAYGLLVAPSSSSAAVAPFSLPRLGGGPAVTYPASGRSGATGTVVTFFASWCTPCQRDLPIVASFVDDHRSAGVRFVGVDGDDAPAAGLAFARKSGVAFPVGSDQTEKVASALGLNGLPDTVFIDSSGHVVHVIRGAASGAQLREWTAQVASS